MHIFFLFSNYFSFERFAVGNIGGGQYWAVHLRYEDSPTRSQQDYETTPHFTPKARLPMNLADQINEAPYSRKKIPAPGTKTPHNKPGKNTSPPLESKPHQARDHKRKTPPQYEILPHIISPGARLLPSPSTPGRQEDPFSKSDSERIFVSPNRDPKSDFNRNQRLHSLSSVRGLCKGLPSRTKNITGTIRYLPSQLIQFLCTVCTASCIMKTGECFRTVG